MKISQTCFFQRSISLLYVLFVPVFIIIGLGGYLWINDQYLGEAFWSISAMLVFIIVSVLLFSPDIFALVIIDEKGMRSKLFGITLWSVNSAEDIIDLKKQVNYMRIMSYRLTIFQDKIADNVKQKTVFIEVSEKSTHYLERFVGMKRFKYIQFKNGSNN